MSEHLLSKNSIRHLRSIYKVHFKKPSLKVTLLLFVGLYSIAPVIDTHRSMTHLKETSSFCNHWLQKNSYIILTSLSSSTPTKYLKILWYWLVKTRIVQSLNFGYTATSHLLDLVRHSHIQSRSKAMLLPKTVTRCDCVIDWYRMAPQCFDSFALLCNNNETAAFQNLIQAYRMLI